MRRRDGEGHLIVRQGDQRLDTVTLQFIEDAIGELQASLIRLILEPRRIYARPIDGKAETLEPHLRQKGDILFVMVVEVHAGVAGVILPCLQRRVGRDKDTGGTATVGYAVEAAEADELTAFVKLLG